MPKLTNTIRLMLGSIIVAIALLIGGYWSTSARHQTHQSAVTSSTKSQSHTRQPPIKSKKRLTRHQLTSVRLPKTNHTLI